MANSLEQCKFCQGSVVSHFCANCGKPTELRRINGAYLLDEISRVVNLDRGFFFTVAQVLRFPGRSIRSFLAEDRFRMMKPMIFLIVSSLIYSLMQGLTGFEDGYMDYSMQPWEGSAVGSIFGWIADNYGYANVVMAFFIALWIKLFFRKQGYNFFEIIVLLCYIIGINMLSFALFGLFEAASGVPILQFGVYVTFLYSMWAIAQFFDGKKVWNYFKALFSYLLGMISFIMVALVLGLMIDKLVLG